MQAAAGKPLQAVVISGHDGPFHNWRETSAALAEALLDSFEVKLTADPGFLADPQLNARIKGLGADPMPMTPTEFGTFMADETEKWAKVVKFSGAKAGP